jgi:hypothetical protein
VSDTLYVTNVHEVAVLDEKHCDQVRCRWFYWLLGGPRCREFLRRDGTDTRLRLGGLTDLGEHDILRCPACRKGARRKP